MVIIDIEGGMSLSGELKFAVIGDRFVIAACVGIDDGALLTVSAAVPTMSATFCTGTRYGPAAASRIVGAWGTVGGPNAHMAASYVRLASSAIRW
jgi:hypothetical protein